MFFIIYPMFFMLCRNFLEPPTSKQLEVSYSTVKYCTRPSFGFYVGNAFWSGIYHP